ncbi:MAG: membrane protein insertase YidC [Candidatus Zixiibacteriota bacterium]|nr:MAG: membrane protein insertase YidC [candidate division Zixibacteria bacterium]
MNKKTILAYILLLLVFLALPYYYRIISPPQPVPSDTLRAPATVTPDTMREAEPPPAPEIATPGPDTTAVQPAGPGGFLREDDPREIIVETPLYIMTLSTRGGVVTGQTLKRYEGPDGTPVQMVRPASDENLDVVLYQRGNPMDLDAVRFEPGRYDLSVPAGGRDSLALTATAGDGSQVRKTLVIYGDEYRADLRLEASGIADLDPFYDLYWGDGLAITEDDTLQDVSYTKAYAYQGGELEKLDAKGDRDVPLRTLAGETRWVSVRTKYFTVALLPQDDRADGALMGLSAQPPVMQGKVRPKVYSVGLRLNDRLTETPGNFTVYLGPLEQTLISRVDPTLESTMDWGWTLFEPFSKLVLWTVRGLHTFISNYGLVLIVFSLLVKIVLWPLTQKSTKAMARMSEVQPKIKELQAKYKDAPEKLNKAMMQLYKDEKVNPFGGCWPTLLQMPLFIGLFIVLRSTIELRNAPFMLWIEDLSQPDVVATLPFSIPMYGAHIAILPILMGITQFMMSKLTITDPKQKFTVYFMPVFMVMIFNTLPSGLSLYYALFNLWTYLQQLYIKKAGLAPAPASSGSRKS